MCCVQSSQQQQQQPAAVSRTERRRFELVSSHPRLLLPCRCLFAPSLLVGESAVVRPEHGRDGVLARTHWLGRWLVGSLTRENTRGESGAR